MKRSGTSKIQLSEERLKEALADAITKLHTARTALQTSKEDLRQKELAYAVIQFTGTAGSGPASTSQPTASVLTPSFQVLEAPEVHITPVLPHPHPTDNSIVQSGIVQSPGLVPTTSPLTPSTISLPTPVHHQQQRPTSANSAYARTLEYSLSRWNDEGGAVVAHQYVTGPSRSSRRPSSATPPYPTHSYTSSSLSGWNAGYRDFSS